LMDPITRPGLSSASDLKALFIMIDHERGVAAPGIVAGGRDCRQSDLAYGTGARYSKRLWSCEHGKATIKKDQIIRTQGVDSGGSGMIERVYIDNNYLAASQGVHFFRDNLGPVRTKPFQTTEADALLPAEVVARGWE
jgi:hypothetical protein